MTVFISNLSYEITAEEVISAFPELKIKSVNLVKSPNGRGRGFGYIELTEPSEVQLALSLDRRLINERPAFISNVTRDKEQRGKFKYSEAMERTKLFVKGLPYDAAKEEVERMFGEFGALKDVRLVCHKQVSLRRFHSKAIMVDFFFSETGNPRESPTLNSKTSRRQAPLYSNWIN